MFQTIPACSHYVNVQIDRTRTLAYDSGMLEDDFCDIIKKARNGLGLKVEDVAMQARLEASALRELEAGRRSPERSEVRAIASALGLDCAKLASIACDAWTPAATEHVSNLTVTTIDGDIGGRYEQKENQGRPE